MQRLHCFSTSKHLLDAPRSSVLGPSLQLLQDLLQIYQPPTRKQAVMKALSDNLPSAHVYSDPPRLAQQTLPVSSSSLDILSFLTLPDLGKEEPRQSVVIQSLGFAFSPPCAMSNMFTHITCGHHSLCQLLLCFCLCTGPWWHLSRVLGCRPDICCYLPTAKAPKTRP